MKTEMQRWMAAWLRGVAVVAFAFSLWWLLGNLLVTAGDSSNWAYWQHYLVMEFGRPLLGLGGSTLFWFAAKPLSGWVVRGLEGR